MTVQTPSPECPAHRCGWACFERHVAAKPGPRHLTSTHGVAAIVGLLLAIGSLPLRVHAQEPPPPATAPEESLESLPKLADMPVPSAEDLLTRPPRDWIVLSGDHVLPVEPVTPRPDTLAKIEQAYEDLLRQKSSKSAEDLQEFQAQLEELKFLAVVLPGEAEAPEYRIPIRMIRQVVHHEDLILKRIDQLTEAGEIDVALELQVLMERRYATWNGVADRHDNLMLADARRRLDAQQPEVALMLAEELLRRSPAQAGLPELLESAASQLASAAWDAGEIARTRHFLNRLHTALPQSAEAARLTALLSGAAERLLKEADVAGEAKDFRLAAIRAEAAAAMWPDVPNLKPRHRIHLARHPRLHVGTTRLTGTPTSYPFVPRAELRAAALSTTTLFHAERLRGGATFYRTRFFNEWEPEDLGRQMQFSLRTHAQPWEMQGPLSANACADLLLRGITPEAASFDERLGTYVDSIRVTSPAAFTVTFRRVPARIEPVLARIAVGRPEAAIPAPPVIAGMTETEDGRGGFALAGKSADEVAFRRVRPEPDGLPRYRTAEVVEHRFESPDRVYQALRRGTVSFVPDLPDWFVREIQESEALSKEFFVLPQAVPTSHFLQFNLHSPPLRSRELRRALAYAIPREAILSETILRDSRRRHGRATRIPFASNLDIAKGDFPTTEHDVPAAIAMALAAAHQLGQGNELPILRLAAPPEPVEQAACAELVRAWKRVGITVELLPDDAPKGEWDIAYRTGQSVEPTLDLWPLVTARDQARLDDLQHLAAWLRHDLVELDRITDSSRAGAFARDVLRKVLADCAVIPLWEVDAFVVVRKTVHDVPPVPMHAYDGLDRWTIDPWYSTQVP